MTDIMFKLKRKKMFCCPLLISYSHIYTSRVSCEPRTVVKNIIIAKSYYFADFHKLIARRRHRLGIAVQFIFFICLSFVFILSSFGFVPYEDIFLPIYGPTQQAL